ncbi:MAG TPA: hypothetical protein VN732_04540 [Solirubrobacterales bacterium]|nr:hypothetical protein [Solirubrobacterales bacterium]
MSKKMMILTVSVAIVATLAQSPAASGSPHHISSVGAFNIKGGTATLSSASGGTLHCPEVTGSGKYETTTTGTLQLRFGPTCTMTLFGVTDHCQSEAQGAPHNLVTETGNIWTTTLPFHIGTDDSANNVILLTPNATGAFAHIECETIFGNVSTTIEGNGVVGRIKSPPCNTQSKTMTLDFNAPAHGVQELTKVTGVIYRLKDGGENAALDLEATATYTDGLGRTLTCT